jgi:hypothetical protein
VTLSRERLRDLGPLLGSVVALFLVHLPVLLRYGLHRDEMYFVECGKHLATGYVDHPPFVPLVARIACELGGCSLLTLRLAPLLARLATVALTIVLVRRLGGRGLAQLAAGLAVVFAPAYERMGKILCIPVFEPVFWTTGALILRALARNGRRELWLALGAVVGIGLLNKHTMLLWAAGAGLAIILSPLRAHLRTRWPFLGATVALVLWAPNLLWQARHDWATLEFLRNIQAGMLADIPRPLFLLGQFLYMHPFSVLLWGAGLAGTVTAPDRRPFVWIFAVALVAFLISGAKPYYLAPAYPPLFAVGALSWERWLGSRTARVGFVTLQVGTGVVMTAFTLPFLSLPATDAIIEHLLGQMVPAVALTHDLHDEYGWREQAQAVASALRKLPPSQQQSATIVTANYGEASAINFYGPALGVPRASTGHMTYYLWGPADPMAELVIAVGLAPEWLAKNCGSLTAIGESDHPLALPHERHLPIHACQQLRRTLPLLWPELRQFDHRAIPPPARQGR